MQPNDTWSMDFMHDALVSGRKFRVLNIIDDLNREALRIEPFFSIGSNLVIKILERLVMERGRPKSHRVDNGPEFISSALSEWCLDKGIKLVYIQPGKPMQNGYIERFNRSYRQDVLDANLFQSIAQARILSDEFQEDYNLHRPHEPLGNLSPVNYRLKAVGRFSKAYCTKNIKKDAMHSVHRTPSSSWIINIPKGLLLSSPCPFLDERN
jgi:putative transposase